MAYVFRLFRFRQSRMWLDDRNQDGFLLELLDIDRTFAFLKTLKTILGSCFWIASDREISTN